jgi:hypothetical protein
MGILHINFTSSYIGQKPYIFLIVEDRERDIQTYE